MKEYYMAPGSKVQISPWSHPTSPELPLLPWPSNHRSRSFLRCMFSSLHQQHPKWPELESSSKSYLLWSPSFWWQGHPAWNQHQSILRSSGVFLSHPTLSSWIGSSKLLCARKNYRPCAIDTSGTQPLFQLIKKNLFNMQASPFHPSVFLKASSPNGSPHFPMEIQSLCHSTQRGGPQTDAHTLHMFPLPSSSPSSKEQAGMSNRPRWSRHERSHQRSPLLRAVLLYARPFLLHPSSLPFLLRVLSWCLTLWFHHHGNTLPAKACALWVRAGQVLSHPELKLQIHLHPKSGGRGQLHSHIFLCPSSSGQPTPHCTSIWNWTCWSVRSTRWLRPKDVGFHVVPAYSFWASLHSIHHIRMDLPQHLKLGLNFGHADIGCTLSYGCKLWKHVFHVLWYHKPVQPSADGFRKLPINMSKLLKWKLVSGDQMFNWRWVQCFCCMQERTQGHIGVWPCYGPISHSQWSNRHAFRCMQHSFGMWSRTRNMYMWLYFLKFQWKLYLTSVQAKITSKDKNTSWR